MKKNTTSLRVESIVATSWARKVVRLFGSMAVDYCIRTKPHIGSKYNREFRFVQNFLKKLGDLTGIEFNYANPITNEPDLLITFLSQEDSIGLRGFTAIRKNKVKIQIAHGNSGYLIGSFKQVAAHELLHAAGLSHPYGSGSYPGATIKDTLMSYNDPNPRFNGITDLDKEALGLIWSSNHDLMI